MAHSSQWFSRKQTAGDLEANMFDSGRQCEFVNANGEDVRYKQPGLRWELFKEIRKETYFDYTGRLQSVFDEFYERVTKRGRTAQPRYVHFVQTLFGIVYDVCSFTTETVHNLPCRSSQQSKRPPFLSRGLAHVEPRQSPPCPCQSRWRRSPRQTWSSFVKPRA